MLNPTRFEEHPPALAFQPMSSTMLSAYFDAKAMSIAARTDLTLQTKLDQLETKLTDTNRLLLALLEQKKKEASLKTHLNHALIALEAINDNEQKVRHAEYASQLIEDHLESIFYLIEHSPDEEREEWNERLDQLRNPTMGRVIKDGVAKLLSPTTWLYRRFAPTALKQRLNQAVPTVDSETLGLLKRFVLSHVFRLTGTTDIDPSSSQLQGELGESNRIIENVSSQLAERDEVMKLQFMYATRNNLEQIQRITHKMIGMIQEYRIQSQRVTENQASLQEVMVLDEKLDDFIAKNDGFFVRLSLFLSRICSFFKTSIARKVEHAEAMKKQLESTRTYYTGAIEIDKTNIAKHRKGISHAFEETLQTTFQQEERAPLAPARPIAPSKYYTIETLFQSIKSKEEKSVNKAEASKVPLRT